MVLAQGSFLERLLTYPSLYNDQFPHAEVLLVTPVIYLATIFTLRRAVEAKQVTWKPNKFSFVHNVFLTIVSLWMFLECMWVSYSEGGFSTFDKYVAFPSRVAYIPRMRFVADVFYWSKFIELIDTVILVLRQRELSFLHVFHHCTTAALCYTSRLGAIQFGVWTNALVHTLMYAHFARPINFIRRYLTTLQIVQFLYCMTFFGVYVAAGHARETPFEIAYNYFCYATYLLFFCKFFYENYISRTAESRRSKKVAPSESSRKRD